MKLKKREWKDEMIQNLEKLEQKDPKEYWDLVNKLREKKQNNTTYNTTEFIKCFEQLYAEDEDDGKLDEYVREAIETLDDSAPDFTTVWKSY